MKKAKLLYVVITILLMSITASAAVFITLEVTKNDDVNSEIYIDPNAKDIIETSENVSETSEGYKFIKINGNEKLYIADNKIKSSTLLCNYNSDYLIRISVCLDNSDLMYQSGLIPSDKGISDVPLLKKLAKGEYKAHIEYEFYTSLGTKSITELDIQVMLIVE
ncbi:MAG: hypothetical protein A2Y17_08995 [Clostridiales bacterium GWF2_38_85]|nr:MAG: hypothetical protein A2Y17_08995 [Clostridiales bacterium GWF2_38_85]HBL83667.1 hypothetical protein [Clostridiales bacterium]